MGEADLAFIRRSQAAFHASFEKFLLSGREQEAVQEFWASLQEDDDESDDDESDDNENECGDSEDGESEDEGEKFKDSFEESETEEPFSISRDLSIEFEAEVLNFQPSPARSFNSTLNPSSQTNLFPSLMKGESCSSSALSRGGRKRGRDDPPQGQSSQRLREPQRRPYGDSMIRRSGLHRCVQ